MDLEKLSLLLKNKKSQNFFIYGLGQAFNLISPIVVVPYIVAVCGEDGLGKTSIGFALSLFLILIVDYAFEIKGTKEASENREDKSRLEKLLTTTVFSKCFLFGVVLVLFLSLVYTVPFFSKEKLLFTLSLSVVFAQVFNPVWFLQGTEQYAVASVLNICSKVLYLVLIYTFISTKADYVYVNLFLGGSALIFNIAGMAYIIKKYSFRASKPDVKEIAAILRADFSFCLSQLFLSVRQLSPIVLISWFLGYYAAGQFKIIDQVVTLFRTFVQVFLKYFYPIVCYKVAQNIKEGLSFWKGYSRYNFLFVLICTAVISLMGEQVLQFFNASPESVTELRPALLLALIVAVLMSVSLSLEQLMFIAGRNKIYIRIVFLVTTINVIAVIAVMDTFGIIGVVSTLIGAELLFISLYFKNSYIHLRHKISQ